MQTFSTKQTPSNHSNQNSKADALALNNGLNNVQKLSEKSPSSTNLQNNQKKADKNALPNNIKNGIENLSGMSLDDVKVHYNSDKPKGVGAHAYAQGNDIHVGPGQEKHLAHEAWHVVQQRQGRVNPTTSVKGLPVNDNPALEKEADVMGAKAVQLKKNENLKSVSQQKISNTAQLEKNEATADSQKIKEDDSLDLKSAKKELIEESQKEESQKEEGPKKGEKEEIPNETESGKEINPAVNNKDKSFLVKYGDTIVDNTMKTGTDASIIGNSIDSIVKVADPETQGSNLLKKTTNTFTKAMGNTTLSKVMSGILGLGAPIISAITNSISAYSKWSQWKAFKKAAEKPAPPKEAEYGLTKIWKGFLKTIKNIVMAISNFMANLLLLIPGAQIVGGPWKAFNTLVGLFDSLFKTGKRIYQWIRGEKKVENSNSLLDKAINGDKDSLQLIFELNLGSIVGSGFSEIDYLTGGITSMTEYLKTSVGIHEEKAERIVDKAGVGGPENTEELHTLLKAIATSRESKNLVLNDLKEAMTGYGTE